MRHTLSLLLVSAILLAGATAALAQDAKKADVQTPAQIQAEMHRAMAELVEARAAEKPDDAKIAALFDRVQELRGKLWAQADVPNRPNWKVAPYGACFGGQCPFGGPAMGRGMGPGKGPGYGYGQGRGWGGPGKGYGYGYGRGYGMCAACPQRCPGCCPACNCVDCPRDCANCPGCLRGLDNVPIAPIPSPKPASAEK